MHAEVMGVWGYSCPFLRTKINFCVFNTCGLCSLQLSAGIDEEGYHSNSFLSLFTVSITLTAAGLAAGRGFGLEVAALLFQYLAMLRQRGPQEWVWRELKVRSRRMALLSYCAIPQLVSSGSNAGIISFIT